MPAVRLLAVVVLLLGASLAHAQNLVLLTENLAPFNQSVSGRNFAKNDGITGISSDTLRAVCKRAQVECQQILRFPWERVYQQALNEPGYGLFSTARTPAREKLFKWVGPIASNDWVLMAKADSPIQLGDLQAAAQYRIGGYKGDAISQYLIDRGLPVQTALRDNKNVEKLLKGQIDLWVTADPSGRYLAKQEGLDGLRVVQRFHTAELYLALNLATPDDLVGRLQEALDALRAEGELGAIVARY
ncbi:ABC transporter substrate-binding protein [Pseudomonas sp. LPB0260]|uniref:substrate-binding periplasmic protein n=1 Tax=Pseudomonas sp. LPB0260 TaxID=2614442 RepID=UPI0015C2B133|nr:ABC transporter substrate-binding protein [Pseudomonas sp. LPB0260]QLC73427.1 ABC transporter substrate-binding protein [Pseudomonas sp. LPB0260]QLC76201.1 ABC transporter substrate-binding protein [Pseudomonas sp. LPB0260]